MDVEASDNLGFDEETQLGSENEIKIENDMDGQVVIASLFDCQSEHQKESMTFRKIRSDNPFSNRMKDIIDHKIEIIQSGSFEDEIETKQAGKYRLACALFFIVSVCLLGISTFLYFVFPFHPSASSVLISIFVILSLVSVTVSCSLLIFSSVTFGTTGVPQRWKIFSVWQRSYNDEELHEMAQGELDMTGLTLGDLDDIEANFTEWIFEQVKAAGFLEGPYHEVVGYNRQIDKGLNWHQWLEANEEHMVPKYTPEQWLTFWEKKKRIERDQFKQIFEKKRISKRK